MVLIAMVVLVPVVVIIVAQGARGAAAHVLAGVPAHAVKIGARVVEGRFRII